MKKILFMIATAISTTSFGQQHVVTYFDAFNIHKHEVYDIDKDAQPNGKYTIYFEDGTIDESASYVHGKLNGKHVKYANYSGIRGIASIESYKMGEFDGLQQEFAGGWEQPIYKKPIEEKFYKNGHLIWSKSYTCPNKEENKRYLWRFVTYKDDQWVWQRGYSANGKTKFSGNRIPDGEYRNYIEDSLQNGKPLHSPDGPED